MEDSVECRSESSYPEKPVAVVWENTRREVEAILSQWRDPEGTHFRVRTNDGWVFELDYNTAADRWHITPI